MDWDPKGERNPQNRGKSKYVRISWDEATDIIAEEIRRIHEEYGPCGILAHGDGHGETKIVHGPHAVQMRLLGILGGYTQAVRNADSWEGWYWGAKHVWGQGENGLMLPADNILNDVTQNTDLLIHIGADLETTPWGFAGQFPSGVLFYWSRAGQEAGLRLARPQLLRAPCTPTSGYRSSPTPTRLCYSPSPTRGWMKVRTTKTYVSTHVVGFDKFENYVMGGEDGVPKTPEWASGKCGVPEWTIKALAREWARMTTSTMHYYGGSYVRGPYSHEPARLECCLLGHAGPGQAWRPPVLQDGRRHAVDDRHARTDTQAGQHSHHEGGLAQWGADCMSPGNRRSPRPLSTRPSWIPR